MAGTSQPFAESAASYLCIFLLLEDTMLCFLPRQHGMQAGEGEDGRLKSAIGIGSLLMDGLGDTIRVSLTEVPEYELEPCRSAPFSSLPSPPLPFLSSPALFQRQPMLVMYLLTIKQLKSNREPFRKITETFTAMQMTNDCS